MSPSAQKEQRLRVAVVGLGSIGGVVTGCLATAGRHEVVACMRTPIEQLTFEWPQGKAELPLAVLSDPAQAEPVDWVLLCTKAYHTPSAAPWLARLCTPSTHVAVLQNGVDHVARVAPLAQGAAVMPVIVYFNGERLGADHVRLRQGADHDVVVADDAAGRAFAQLFAGTPLRVALGEDFTTLAWRKLLVNSVASPLTALTMQRQAVLRRKDVQELCLAVLAEVIAVARAEGAHLADSEAAQALAMLFTFSPDAATSMYSDRMAGRTLEVEALNGVVVALGERHGIPTPLNRVLVTLLRAINDAPKPAESRA